MRIKIRQRLRLRLRLGEKREARRGFARRGKLRYVWENDCMLHDTISNIEGRIRNSGAVDESHRAELLKLLGQLRGEIAALSKTHQEQAESIASFAEVSAQEATRETKNPETLRHSIGG